jgi:hypothetical protein
MARLDETLTFLLLFVYPKAKHESLMDVSFYGRSGRNSVQLVLVVGEFEMSRVLIDITRSFKLVQ